ncbi:MAG: hypothetical protein V3V01_19985 [Acidimicrobiales bacterium]
MSIESIVSFIAVAVLVVVFILSALTLAYLVAVVAARSYQRVFRR